MDADEPVAGRRLNIVGVNLPHIVFQPIEGEVQYKTGDVTPVFWYHFTPDALVVPEASPHKTFQDFVAAAKEGAGQDEPGRAPAAIQRTTPRMSA